MGHTLFDQHLPPTWGKVALPPHLRGPLPHTGQLWSSCHGCRRRHHGGMVFLLADTVRERTRRLLADAAEPLTVAVIAEELATTPVQARRALRQLEQEAAAVRQPGPRPRGWRTPDTWTSQ